MFLQRLFGLPHHYFEPMSLLGIDLGGTKLAIALFSDSGNIVSRETAALAGRKGPEVGKMITDLVSRFLADPLPDPITAIGVSVPGIYRPASGTVWAPNIPDWDDYPLLQEMQDSVGDIPVAIDSDRSCYILGEIWQGNAKGCSDAIFLAVGTGIGAGIVIEDRVFRGASGIAGAIGWLALDRPYHQKYDPCGCFEYHASGEGLVKTAREVLSRQQVYSGALSGKASDRLTAADIFSAFSNNDPVAIEVLQQAIDFWGMAVANLVSLFNPEKIIFGGGVFGPALQFLPEIRREALKWAQPISFTKVTFEPSGLGSDAGVYGAGYLALKHLRSNLLTHHD